jgi:hypothetical protein
MPTLVDIPEEPVWQAALKHCWTIVEIATKLSDVLNRLNGTPVSAVSPVLSTFAPSILITPERPEDVESVRALCRLIHTKLESKAEWTHRASGGRWLFALPLEGGGLIEVNSMIPSTEPKPVKL